MKLIIFYIVTVLLPIISISTFLQTLISSPLIYLGRLLTGQKEVGTANNVFVIVIIPEFISAVLLWVGIDKLWKYFTGEYIPNFLWLILFVITLSYIIIYKAAMNDGFKILKKCELAAFIFLVIYFFLFPHI